jgi:hypothetical protein
MMIAFIASDYSGASGSSVTLAGTLIGKRRAAQILLW